MIGSYESSWQMDGPFEPWLTHDWDLKQILTDMGPYKPFESGDYSSLLDLCITGVHYRSTARACSRSCACMGYWKPLLWTYPSIRWSQSSHTFLSPTSELTEVARKIVTFYLDLASSWSSVTDENWTVDSMIEGKVLPDRRIAFFLIVMTLYVSISPVDCILNSSTNTKSTESLDFPGDILHLWSISEHCISSFP